MNVRAFFAHPLVRLVLILGPFSLVLAGIIAFVRGRTEYGHGPVVMFVVVGVLISLMLRVELSTTGRTAAQLGFDRKRAFGDTSRGVLLGVVLFSAVVLELALAGCYRVTGVQFPPGLLLSVLTFILGAVFEEVLFRGVLFRLLEELCGTWVALGLSAVLFGAAHAFNPGASWVSTIAIAIEAGVLLGATYVVTRNLWLPIGLHFAWNFCEGPVFGTQVSGTHLSQSLLQANINGPVWLTGGAFGPEAGAFAIATSLVATILLLRYAVKKSLVRPPRAFFGRNGDDAKTAAP